MEGLVRGNTCNDGRGMYDGNVGNMNGVAVKEIKVMQSPFQKKRVSVCEKEIRYSMQKGYYVSRKISKY